MKLRYRVDVHSYFTDVMDKYRVISYSCPVLVTGSHGLCNTRTMDIEVMSLPVRNLLLWTSDPHCLAIGCIYYDGMETLPAVSFDAARCLGLHIMHYTDADKESRNIIRLRIKAEITACGKIKL